MTARRRAAAIVAIVLGIGAIAYAYARCAAHREVAAPIVHAPSPIPRVRLAELRHQAPSSIAGTVTSAGAAVASATVCARTRDVAPRCVATGDDGTWQLDELAPATYAIWASAPGFGGGAIEVTTAAGEARGDIRLELLAGAVELHGMVLDVRGKPIAGAVLQVSSDSRARPTYAASSDATGAFAAWALPGNVHVAASADGFVDADVDTVAPDAAIAIAMTPGGSIAGTVVDATMHAPIADADVDIDGARAQTDAAGRFRIAKLRPGRYKPSATSIGGYGEAAESVRVPLGAAVEGIVIEIHPVAVVAGHVLIADGAARQPCAADRGEVWLDRHGGAASYLARTLDDGQILLEGVVPGTYGVVAKCRGYLSAVPYPDLIVGDSDVDDVTWLVSRGARVAGRVRARNGEAIPGATINARSTDGASFATTTAGSGGEFVVEGLRAGAASIDASADGFLPSAQSVPAVAAVGEPARCEVVLDRGGAIAGVVVDPRGDPAPGARVTVREGGPDGAEDGAVRADRSGAFRFDALGARRLSRRRGERARRARGASRRRHGGRERDRERARHRAAGERRDRRRGRRRGRRAGGRRVRRDRPRRRGGRERVRPALRVEIVARARRHDRRLSLRRFPARRVRPARVSARRRGDDRPPRRARRARHHRARADRGARGRRGSASGAPMTDVVITAADRAHDISRDERAYFTGGRFALRELPAGT